MEAAGRQNQRRRTRKDLLVAAARLVKQGRKPNLEEIAQEALVSRATAYRYFPSVEALLVEASFDIAIPGPDELFRNGGEADPVARMQVVDAMLHDVILANEVPLRMMLVHSLQRAMAGQEAEVPRRQNRRMPFIEAALEPVRHQFSAAVLDTLSKALALVIGTEGMIVIKDVLQLDDADARRVKRWAIRALIEAAMAEPRAKSSRGAPRQRSSAGPTGPRARAKRSHGDSRNGR